MRVCARVRDMISLMRRSDVHSNALELTSREHQIRMIYSPALAYGVNCVEQRHNNKASVQFSGLTEQLFQGNRPFIAFSYLLASKVM